MAERRQVEAARGREKLELARQRADQEIRRLREGRDLPRFHATLLEQTWTDVLSLAHLRNGPDSDACRQLLDVTARIIERIVLGASRRPVAVVLTPPDPDRPKRGGWWNRLAGRK